MATRSLIIMEVPENVNKYEYIYCHWDGYYAGVGAVLLKYYSDSKRKVQGLINLGDISILGRFLEPDSLSLHTFDIPQSNVTVAYGRDRGDKDTCKEVSDSLPPAGYKGTEYRYLYKDGEWYVSHRNEDFYKLSELNMILNLIDNS